MFNSFSDRPLNCVIIGATGGIGAAFLDVADKSYRIGNLHALSRRTPPTLSGSATWLEADILDEASLKNAADAVSKVGPIDICIVATGILHEGRDVQPEKALKQLDEAAFTKVLAINTIGPALCLKHFAPHLSRDEKSVLAALSARVGSISDNRLGGWYSYRASKAALNQILRTAAIEVARKHPKATVIGLHPGTVATPLSEPFQNNRYERFSPEHSATCLMEVIDKVGPADSGHVFDWKGERIPE